MDLYRTGVPKLSLSMYPFSISIDEHVPLKIGAGRIFFQGGGNSRFSRGKSTIFLQWGQKWQNYIFTT